MKAESWSRHVSRDMSSLNRIYIAKLADVCLGFLLSIISDNLLFHNQPKFTITTFSLMLKLFLCINISLPTGRLVSQLRNFFPCHAGVIQADICYLDEMGGEHLKNKCGFFSLFPLQQEMPYWLKTTRPHERNSL
uniref:Uncharacterized protein n=1 Tax=Micrurus lemniscatus lemniscatus TaxID=129467 RepID=A0A2D4HYL6_MICLE